MVWDGIAWGPEFGFNFLGAVTLQCELVDLDDQLGQRSAPVILCIIDVACYHPFRCSSSFTME